jgi:hypothetical protein
VQPNVGRYTTGVWTRQYLEQQLRLVLAGRAAEELVYGIDEMSSLHQLKIMQARQVRIRAVALNYTALGVGVWGTGMPFRTRKLTRRTVCYSTS